jgi:hypothetical protein
MSRHARASDTVSPVSSTGRHPLATEADRADASGSGSASRPRRPSGGSTAARRWWRWSRDRLRGWWQTPAAFDVAACLIFLCFSGWLFRGLWPSPATRAIADNVNDQALIEWFLSHGVLFWTGDFSLVTDRLNAPDGVNLMSNASHITHGVLMAPVTVLFGAAASFAVLAVVNLAATAAGWYLLLARTLNLSRGAAIVGGAVAGFAPGMISQSNSHLHMTAQWLVPPIVWCVIRLTRVQAVRQVVTTAVGLALLVVVQLFLGEEVLFLTALTLALFAATYAVARRDWARQVAARFVAGMALATGLATIMVAYPLWVQFRGPQHTPNAPFGPAYFYADLASFTAFSPLSIAGSPDAGRLATSSAEYNTYLGLPLLLVVLGCLVWRWRSPVTVAILVTGIVMTLLSLGPFVTLNGERTGWPSLYNTIAEVPVITGALPTRYALALIPLIAVLLAYAMDAATRAGRWTQILVPVAVVVALVPTLPKAMATSDRQPVPTFITSGAWRQCAPEGGVIVPVPLPTPGQPDAMRWPAAANAEFAIPEGFFIGPYGPDGKSSIGTYPRPLSQLLAAVAKTGQVPPIDDQTRAQARQDLGYWGADCVALAHVRNEEPLRTTLEQLLGAGQPVADTWTWRIGG